MLEPDLCLFEAVGRGEVQGTVQRTLEGQGLKTGLVQELRQIVD